jgi:hypothetical protein
MQGFPSYNCTTMTKFQLTHKHSPALLALLTIIAYGLLLPITGFYWDDWPFAWIARFLGPKEFIPAFMPFRPFLGPIFYFTTSLIPTVPLYWQVFALIIRFIIGISALWTFKQIWPDRPRTALIAALFILIFPGYSQHWVAFTHINQELIPFIFYILSFGFTFKALRTKKTTDIIIAILLQVCGIFPTEYFFGIEGIRFLLLFSILQGSLIERFTKTLKVWLPYLLIWTLNTAWLFYYYKFGPYNSYEVTATRSITLSSMLIEALDALWKAGVYIWIQVLPLTFSSITAPASILTLGLIAISFIFLALYLSRLSQTTSTPSDTSGASGASGTSAPSPLSLIIIGILGILLGRLPSLAAGLPLTLQSSYDRFMVSIMIGGCLFLLGIIELIFKESKSKVYVVALIVALGVGQQFFNANIFRRDWQKQRDIYWQMAWRIPVLKPNTVLLTHQMPIDYETDISFTAPVNWMYAPEYSSGDLPYLMLYSEKRLGGPTLPALEPNIPITFPYRRSVFHGNTSQMVVIYMPANGCLRVLDSARGDDVTYGSLPDSISNAIPLSNPSLILINAQTPAAPMFFPEPEHGWCYFHAKAELAQQQGDYQAVVSLGEEAASLGLKPEDPNEWLPFIESYALTGNLEKAKALSEQILDENARNRRGVCTVWKQIQAKGPDGSEDQIAQLLLSFKCNP